MRFRSAGWELFFDFFPLWDDLCNRNISGSINKFSEFSIGDFSFIHPEAINRNLVFREFIRPGELSFSTHHKCTGRDFYHACYIALALNSINFVLLHREFSFCLIIMAFIVLFMVMGGVVTVVFFLYICMRMISMFTACNTNA